MNNKIDKIGFMQAGGLLLARRSGTLRRAGGECRDILYKSIEVVDEGLIKKHDEDEPLIKNFVIYPNPNNGNFTVRVELSKPANYALRLYNESGVLVEMKEIANRMVAETPFAHAGAGSGVHFLHFICTDEQMVSVYKIIIN